MRSVLTTILAAAGLFACLSACSRDPGVAGEVVVLNERLTLVRGESQDTFRRELIAPADGTCVAIVEEDNVDVILELQAAKEGAAPAKIEVDSGSLGEGVEVAAIPVARGSKVSLYLSSPPEMTAPTRVQTRIMCYDDAAQTQQTQARVTAYRAWTEATLTSLTSADETVKRCRELLEVAITQLRSNGAEPGMAAWAQLLRGAIYNNSLDDLRRSLPEVRAAEKAFATLENPEPRNAARARFNAAAMMNHLINDGTSKNPTAAEAKAEAIKIFTELSSESSPASAVEKSRAIKFLGVICFNVADYPCATRYFLAAADASRKVGHRSDELSTVYNLAATENDLGNFANAKRYFDRVVPLIGNDLSTERYVTYHSNAGVAYANFGDTTRAITHLLLALDGARKRESVLELGRVMYGLGFAYWLRGDTQQAETYFAESLAQRRKQSDAPGLILSLNIVGRFARYQGRFDEAQSMHREALERSATPGMKLRSNYELALDHAAAGQFDRAIKVCRASLAEAGSLDPHKRTQTQVLLAQFLLEGKPGAAALDEAEQIARAALALALEKSDSVLELSSRHVLAKVLAIRGKHAAARVEYETAIAVILDFRGSTASPELQASTVAHEQEIFREYVDLLMRGAGARGTDRFAPTTPDEEDALRVLELARTSSASPLRDLQLDAATQARIDALLQEMAAKRVRIAALNDRATPGGKVADTLQLEMSQLRAEVERLRGGTSDGTRSTKLPGSVNRPWPAVEAGATQLSYALGKRNVYLWARDAQGLRVAVLAQSPANLERALSTFSKINQIRTPDKLEQSLAELSSNLLPPGTLGDASSSLEIIADGTLGTLPFAALRVPGSGKRVVETHGVRMIASMFDVGVPASDKPRALAFVGIASNTGELRSAAHVFPSLGAARAEARAIADLFITGNDSTRIKLLTAADGDAETLRAIWTGGADAVHFATHGLANMRYPSGSLLLLPKGGGAEAAYLTAGQVREWRGDAGLVFLAACETAAGPARFAEGMSGLPRSFLSAGARGIVATLWPVEDVYESEFSVEFYRRFIVAHDAESALAETQREWLKPRPGEKPSAHQQRLATAWAHVFSARPKSR